MKNFEADRQLNSSNSKSNVDDVIGGRAFSTCIVDRSKSLLDKEQVQRLLNVLDEEFEVHGRGNFPTLKIQPGRLIRLLATRVQAINLSIKRVKLNGGAASFVIANQKKSANNRRGNYLAPDISVDDRFSDFDLIFDVDLEAAENFDLFKQCALETLIDFLPELANRSKITHSVMQEAYVKKMVKIVGCSPYKNSRRANHVNTHPVDLWSLITLNNNEGRCIELKFVDRMRRQFEFSVDSFQIHLDHLLLLNGSSPIAPSSVSATTADVASDRRRASTSGGTPTATSQSSCTDDLSSQRRRRLSTGEATCGNNVATTGVRKLSAAASAVDRCETNVDFDWSTARSDFSHVGGSSLIVVAESAFGDFWAASEHLRRKQIATTQPELIRGGGLLKYVHLLVKGYRPVDDDDADADCLSAGGKRRDGDEAVQKLERYMCSRFFIDFGRLDQQERKLRAYLDDHLRSYSQQAKYDFLALLYRVIDESTVCLMNHERHQTLNLLCQLMSEVEFPLLNLSTPIPAVASSSASVSCCSSFRGNFYKPPPTLESQIFAFHQPPSHLTFVPARSAPAIERFAAGDVRRQPAVGVVSSTPTFFYVPQQQQQPTFWIPVV